MDTAERTASAEVGAYDGFISYSHAADGLLAPRLQLGLQRFAKPWWKRRALRVFRDESSLSANPHLWSSITDALDESSWFVLLLSPDAARSPWVNQEIEYWVEHKDAGRILPVVTAGGFGWSNGDVTGDSVPDTLRGVFAEEPRWVDLRFARDEEQLDLKNPRFSSAVADIASALRGVAKDELESEEVRQHRRTIRTAWAAGIVVAVLAVAATLSALFAIRQRNEARARALGSAAVAALGPQADPRLARLLSLEAILATGSVEDQPKSVVDTLFTSLVDDRLLRTIEVGDDGYTALDLSHAGSRLAVSSESGAVVRMYAVPEAQLLWEYSEPDTSDRFVSVRVDPTGTFVAVSVEDSLGAVRGVLPDDKPNRVLILDGVDGHLVHALEYPECQTAQILGSGWSPDGSQLVISHGWGPCQRPDAPDGTWIEVFDGHTFEQIALIDTVDPDASWASFGGSELFVMGWSVGTTAYSGSDYSVERPIEGQTGPGVVTPDGSLITSIDLDRPTDWFLLNADDGSKVEGVTAPAYPAVPQGWAFSPDGGRFIVETEGNQTLVWDTASGELLFELQTGRGGNPAMSPDGTLLYTSHVDGTVKIWDLGPRSVATRELGDFGRFDYVNANHITLGDQFGATEVLDMGAMDAERDRLAGDTSAAYESSAEVAFFDRGSGELVGRSLPGSGVFALSDGRFVVTYWDSPEPDRYQPSRGAAVYDPSTDALVPLFGCPSMDPAACPVDNEPRWVSVSQDGTRIMLWNATDGRWRVLDPDGAVVGDGQSDVPWSWVSTFTDEWIFGYSEVDVSFVAIDAVTGERLAGLGVCGCREELSPTRKRLATADGGRVTVVDLGSWDKTTVQTKAGHVRAMAFNEDETLLAVADDRAVHVLDIPLGEVVQSIPARDASDFYWRDEETLIMGTQDGRWTQVSLDLNELVALALEQTGRGYVESECALYAVTPCPTSWELVRERYAGLVTGG